MKWIRWRTKWAWGCGDWEYDFVCEKDLADENEMGSVLNEKADSDWSDKYRGVEWFEIDKPPKEWVVEEANKARNVIKWKTEWLEYLVRLSDTYGEEDVHVPDNGGEGG